MKTSVAIERGAAAVHQLTDGDLAVVAGGLSLSDFILPKVKPRDPVPVLPILPRA